MKASNTQTWERVASAYFSHLLFPLFILGVVYRRIFLLLPVAFVMVLVPILDSLSKEDSTNGELVLSSWKKRLVEMAPLLFVIGNACVVGIGAYLFRGLSISEKVFTVLGVGVIGSIGITAAHELVHKLHGIPKIFGRLGLANVCYLHFEVAHIQGHHVRVGTEDDQSTAWFGESLYLFVFRTVPGCLKLAWELEKQRLNRHELDTVSLKNNMIQFALLQSAYLAVIWYLGTWNGIAFFLLQAAVAVFMLETTSYIEHYGLLRAKEPDGKYAPMSPENSWDCYGRFSNYLVFQLQRHADHHSYPTRPFSNLQTASEAPKLPVGYPLLIGIAMIPPLWRKTMDNRVRALATDVHRLAPQ
jgi:alkane 1-monooxygenase